MTRDLTVWLLRTCREVLPPLGWSVIMRVVGLVAGAALLGIAVGGVISVGAGDLALTTLVWSLVAVALAKAAARYLEQYAGHYVAFRSLALLRVTLFRRLEPRAPAAVEGRRTGDILSRATRDVDRVEVFFAHALGPALTAVVVPLGVAVWLAVYAGPVPALVALAGWAIIIVAASVGWRASADASAALRRERGELAQQLTDSIQGVAEVVGFGAQSQRLDLLDSAGNRIAAHQAVRGRVAALRRAMVVAVTVALPVVVFAAALPFAPWHVAIVAAAVVMGTTPAAIAVEEFAAELDQAFASAARLREVIDGQPTTPQPAAPASAPSTVAEPPEVVLDAVTFAYPTADSAHLRPAVSDVTVTCPAGRTTALVGASGAGKSTLGSLIARFHDPNEGAVRLGGVDVRDLADEDLRSLVSVVAQRPYLFRGTIRDNLLIAAPDEDDEALRAVCERAGLGGTLERLPDGLDTVVGEHGTRLSGGERQRVAIARTLLRDTPVVVFDEVTSEVDRETEATITLALRELAKDRTVIVIAHRLSTVRDADQIVALDAGRVVETGTHAQLVAKDAAYARLWDRQHAAPAATSGTSGGVAVADAEPIQIG